MHQIGKAGEKLVAKWLKTQNWQILHQQWRCRFGEIDIIALN
ncbi:MAG: YraN family protein, partial [Cyanobacteria bacterium J083]